VSDALCWLAAAVAGRFSAPRFDAFHAHFGGDAARMRAAGREELMQLPGIGARTAALLLGIDYAAWEERARRWAESRVRWHLSGEKVSLTPDVPHPLAGRHGRPAALFWLGLEDAFQPGTPRIGVVGTRQPSAHGARLAEQIAYDAGRMGAVIVSGLALGIDTLAHEGALTAGSRTIAVLGGGMLRLYPPENMNLAARIAASGVVTCEVAPDMAVSPQALVARNRLIAAFCDALVVVETETDGGAMHAARFALENRQRVFTPDLPASGNQALIAAGAQPLPADIRVEIESLLA
jgi:DNA processing protein